MTASRRRGAPGARGDGTRLLGGLVPRRGRGMRRADDGARSARPSVPDRPGPAAAMAAKGRSGQMAHGAGRQGYGRRVYTRWRRTDRARTTAKYDDGTEHRDLTGPRAAKVSNGETSWRMTNTQVHVRLISAGRSRGKYILSLWTRRPGHAGSHDPRHDNIRYHKRVQWYSPTAPEPLHPPMHQPPPPAGSSTHTPRDRARVAR